METPNQLGFFDLANRYEALSQRGDPLEQLAEVIPWEVLRPTLAQVLRRSRRTQGGRPPFEAVLMFKILVLQALYTCPIIRPSIRFVTVCPSCGSCASIWRKASRMPRRSGCFAKPSLKPKSSRASLRNLKPIWPSTAYNRVAAN